jgi:hypothetical protein
LLLLLLLLLLLQGHGGSSSIHQPHSSISISRPDLPSIPRIRLSLRLRPLLLLLLLSRRVLR